jgi:hypothetical protein
MGVRLTLCFGEDGKYFLQADRGKGFSKAGAAERGATKPGWMLGRGDCVKALLGGDGVT